jgi:hypothetical protein
MRIFHPLEYPSEYLIQKWTHGYDRLIRAKEAFSGTCMEIESNLCFHCGCHDCSLFIPVQPPHPPSAEKDYQKIKPIQKYRKK